MSTVVNEVLTANQRYASNFGNKGNLPMPPGRHFAILTCKDAHLDPAQYTGLAEGDAHVIRNAGGHASDDDSRSLVISHKLLGTREWIVIHHTDCGMETFTDELMRKLLRGSLKTASVDASGWHDAGGGGWHTAFAASPRAGRIVWGQRAPLTRPLQEPPQAHYFLIAVPPGRSRRFPQRARACLPAGDHPSAA